MSWVQRFNTLIGVFMNLHRLILASMSRSEINAEWVTFCFAMRRPELQTPALTKLKIDFRDAVVMDLTI